MVLQINETVAIIKPDGLEKGLLGEIKSRILKLDLNIVEEKRRKLTQEEVGLLYHQSLLRFPEIGNSMLEYLTTADSVILHIAGDDAVSKVFELRGASNPAEADKGSIRGDYVGDIDMKEMSKKNLATKNIFHASDSDMSARYELYLFFGRPEIF